MRSASKARLLILAVAVAAIAGCGGEASMEQQVIAEIRALESHVDQRERRPFMARVDNDFRGQDGSLDYQQLNALLLYQLRRYAEINTQLLPITVTPRGTEGAHARFQVMVTGGANWLPESGQLYQVETVWRRRDGEWRLLQADWRPVLGAP